MPEMGGRGVVVAGKATLDSNISLYRSTEANASSSAKLKCSEGKGS